jgi:hypothetical protein
MDVDMPEAPQPAQNRQGGEFKARLNRDIAFTIIDEQIQAGIEPAQLTGRGLAKQYGFGSPQTWVTHLKEWRQLRGLAPGSEDVKEAETAPADDEEGDDAPGTSDTAANPGGGGYGMISRTEFLQHQEMWNRLLSEREQAHAERLKVARMEGVQVGRDAGRQEGQALAEARELTLQERARRERLEGEREGAMKAQQELAVRLGGERRLLVSLAIVVGITLGALGGGAAMWWATARTTADAPVAPVAQPPVTQPIAPPQSDPHAVAVPTAAPIGPVAPVAPVSPPAEPVAPPENASHEPVVPAVPSP